MKPDAVKPLLVGETNPYGADPKFALYPLPEKSAGGRLCTKIMGLTRLEYLQRFDRVNLCAGKWSMKEARHRAVDLLGTDERSTLVLFGAKVTRAFDIDFFPFQITHRQHERRVVILPHPSGLCRAWNEPGAYERARAVLREAGVL